MNSIRHWLWIGTGEWWGWSYPYASLIASRVRRGNHALNLLEIYEKAFTWPNGFHADVDYTLTRITSVWKDDGIWPGSPVFYTMEGECAFTAAVNEMLLQSWGGKLRVFPAVPDAWEDVTFENLRAEGALLVSAERRNGRVTHLSILSEKGGEVRLVGLWVPSPTEKNGKSV